MREDTWVSPNGHAFKTFYNFLTKTETLTKNVWQKKRIFWNKKCFTFFVSVSIFCFKCSYNKNTDKNWKLTWQKKTDKNNIWNKKCFAFFVIIFCQGQAFFVLNFVFISFCIFSVSFLYLFFIFSLSFLYLFFIFSLSFLYLFFIFSARKDKEKIQKTFFVSLFDYCFTSFVSSFY